MKHDVVIADFESADLVLGAAMRVRELGFSALDAITPHPIPELDEVLAIRRTRVRWLVLFAAVAGAALAFAVLHWTNAIDYPLDVGGRPLASYPSYVPIMFETCVLLGASAAFAGVLLGSGLPRLHHPLFEIEGFEGTTIDRFWLVVRDVADEEHGTLVAELQRMGAVLRSPGVRS